MATNTVFRSTVGECLRATCAECALEIAEAWMPATPGVAFGSEGSTDWSIVGFHASPPLQVSLIGPGGRKVPAAVDFAMAKEHERAHTLSRNLCMEAAATEATSVQHEFGTDDLMRLLRVPVRTAVAAPVLVDGRVRAVIVAYTQKVVEEAALRPHIASGQRTFAQAIEWLDEGRPSEKPGDSSPSVDATPVRAAAPVVDTKAGATGAGVGGAEKASGIESKAGDALASSGDGDDAAVVGPPQEVVCYDGPLAPQYPSQFQMAVKVCQRTVCKTLRWDVAEVWFQGGSSPDGATFEFAYLVVGLGFHRRHHRQLKYPEDPSVTPPQRRSASGHVLSTRICESVLENRGLVWWDEADVEGAVGAGAAGVAGGLKYRSCVGVPIFEKGDGNGRILSILLLLSTSKRRNKSKVRALLRKAAGVASKAYSDSADAESPGEEDAGATGGAGAGVSGSSEVTEVAPSIDSVLARERSVRRRSVGGALDDDDDRGSVAHSVASDSFGQTLSQRLDMRAVPLLPSQHGSDFSFVNAMRRISSLSEVWLDLTDADRNSSLGGRRGSSNSLHRIGSAGFLGSSGSLADGGLAMPPPRLSPGLRPSSSRNTLPPPEEALGALTPKSANGRARPAQVASLGGPDSGAGDTPAAVPREQTKRRTRSAGRRDSAFRRAAALRASSDGADAESSTAADAEASTSSSGDAAPAKYPANVASEIADIESSVPAVKSVVGDGLRSGKWPAEEEAYALQVIGDFKQSLLPLKEGDTLRAYLSDELHCIPMRVTKKFTGQNSVGKQVFKPLMALAYDDSWKERVRDAAQKRMRLKDAFVKNLVDSTVTPSQAPSKRRRSSSIGSKGGTSGSPGAGRTTPSRRRRRGSGASGKSPSSAGGSAARSVPEPAAAARASAPKARKRKGSASSADGAPKRARGKRSAGGIVRSAGVGAGSRLDAKAGAKHEALLNQSTRLAIGALEIQQEVARRALASPTPSDSASAASGGVGGAGGSAQGETAAGGNTPGGGSTPGAGGYAAPPLNAAPVVVGSHALANALANLMGGPGTPGGFPTTSSGTPSRMSPPGATATSKAWALATSRRKVARRHSEPFVGDLLGLSRGGSAASKRSRVGPGSGTPSRGNTAGLGSAGDDAAHFAGALPTSPGRAESSLAVAAPPITVAPALPTVDERRAHVRRTMPDPASLTVHSHGSGLFALGALTPSGAEDDAATDKHIRRWSVANATEAQRVAGFLIDRAHMRTAAIAESGKTGEAGNGDGAVGAAASGTGNVAAGSGGGEVPSASSAVEGALDSEWNDFLDPDLFP